MHAPLAIYQACRKADAARRGNGGRAAGQVRLMSPEYVRPHVKSRKNDDRAIAEAGNGADDAVCHIEERAQLDMHAGGCRRRRTVRWCAFFSGGIMSAADQSGEDFKVSLPQVKHWKSLRPSSQPRKSAPSSIVTAPRPKSDEPVIS